MQLLPPLKQILQYRAALQFSVFQCSISIVIMQESVDSMFNDTYIYIYIYIVFWNICKGLILLICPFVSPKALLYEY